MPRGATALPSPLLAADVDALATSSLEHNGRAPFRVFAGDELGTARLLVFELSYPETRVRGLGLPDEARVGAESSLRLEAPWACDGCSGGKASGSGEFRIFDPAGTSRSTSAFGWNRLFQGREYIGVVDAYDFRARILWPEIGRFGQEDPVGTLDSLNLYQALLGSWTALTDSSGQAVEYEWSYPPYNRWLGTYAHEAWFGWLRRNVFASYPRGRVFYNQAVSTAQGLRAIGRRTAISKKQGRLSPDIAKFEVDGSFTVWELKPETWDPLASSLGRFDPFPDGAKRQSRLLRGIGQIRDYVGALSPANVGDSTTVARTKPKGTIGGHTRGDFIEVIPGLRGQTYRMWAYSREAYKGTGLVFYELNPNMRDDGEEVLRARQRNASGGDIGLLLLAIGVMFRNPALMEHGAAAAGVAPGLVAPQEECGPDCI